jgi:leucyl/phenylalanyl-tRNA---protein transferase
MMWDDAPWLSPDDPFPDTRAVLDEPAGLLAFGADLSPQRLLAAYSQGIFPWFSEEPIMWWFTSPRMVLYLSEFRLHRSLRKALVQFDIRVNTAFAQVIQHCAEAERDGQAGTWITEEMQAAYGELHRQGHAHSVEAWQGGRLVGGLYGISIGRMFYGESMFALVSNASKAALAYLGNNLKQRGFELIDCQQVTDHLASLGGRPIEADVFRQHLATLTKQVPITPW